MLAPFGFYGESLQGAGEKKLQSVADSALSRAVWATDYGETRAARDLQKGPDPSEASQTNFTNSHRHPAADRLYFLCSFPEEGFPPSFR